MSAALHTDEVGVRALELVRAALGHDQFEVITEVGEASPTEPLAVLVVTGGTEHQVLDAWRQRAEVAAGEPLVLIAHPDHNSLPAALEALARLRAEGARARIASISHDGDGSDLRSALHDASTWHRLHRARLGLVGEPSDWLVASVPDPDLVRRRWGVEVVSVPLAPVLDRFDENIAAPLATPVQLAARPHDHAPHPADIETAARFEPVLRGVVRDERLDAVAVRCFDLISRSHTSGCLALSALNDAGTIAGCEGDLATTLAMLWVRELTGRQPWMANPAAVDRTTGVLELAHCTVALSMVEGFRLDTHFESNLGVGITGELPPGPVTVVRLGGQELDQLWCEDGTALLTNPRPERCRTQLDVRVWPEAAAHLLDHPLGNHLVVVYGHHAAHLRAWWQEMIA
ncbi:MAG TPA: hypothetical protein PLV13_05940 [Ilumatobacteraceae bacterium]|nr:hypothetical protein [Ilumatobacteraceae bacterium]